MRHSLFGLLGVFVLITISMISSAPPIDAKTDPYKIKMSWFAAQDTTGDLLDYATVDETVVITSNVSSRQDEKLPFTMIAEVRDHNDVTVYLSTLEGMAGQIQAEDHTTVNFSWRPNELGEHRIMVIALSSLTNPEILGWQRTLELNVLAECDQPNCRVLGDDDAYRLNYRATGTVRDGPAKQQEFTGLFTHDTDESCETARFVRCTPYKLDSKSVYTGSSNLDEFVGEVRIRDMSIPS